MDVLLGGLELLLEGVVPGEGDGVDVVPVGGDREAGLDDAEGAEVGLEDVAAGGGGGLLGGVLEVGAEVAEGLEVVLQVLGLALGVVEGDVGADGAVEVDGRRLLLEDGEHDVGGRQRRRHLD